MKKRICAILVDRANYGRLWPALSAIREQPELELEVVCSGSMVLERFGRPVEVVRSDGFRVVSEVFLELEGSIPLTMAKSLGLGIGEFANTLHSLRPDLVLLIGDRYEALAAGLAASYQNFCIAHVQGGEVSGSIDETARHCLTKISHFHFPATQRSADYIIRMGERPDTVFHVGCPSGDIAFRLDRSLPREFFLNRGSGGRVYADEPYLLVMFHPVTTTYGSEEQQVQEMIAAVRSVDMPTVWLWPNIDAGSNHVSKALRIFAGQPEASRLRLLKNLPPEDFLRVLANAACAVGNSSSFVRDASFLGTPVVLVGDRQTGRETAEHLVKSPASCAQVVQAVHHQLGHGRYPASHLYGDGQAGVRIARKLAELEPYTQKTLHYALETRS